MEGLVYVNGSMVPASEAHVSVFDHGFLYGYALFETMRAYNGKIFLEERHLKRLADAAETISLDITGFELSQVCRDTMEANNLKEARIRLTVTSGVSDALPWVAPKAKSTVIAVAQPYTSLPADKYEKGFRVKIASVQRCSHSPISRLKSTNYLVNVMARLEATREGFDEALLLNESGAIVEGSTSNVFFVTGTKLVTPPWESGVLPGVTRGLVMELAKELDIMYSEADIRIPEISHYDEVFLTASTVEIVPVVEITDRKGKKHTIGDGKPGEITRRLSADYKSRVAIETGG